MRNYYWLACLLLCSSFGVRAQPEQRNWRFGIGPGLAFPPSGPPVVVAGCPMRSDEGCSAISDPSGNLLCYTNSAQVWDRTNALMPNGTLQTGYGVATQGALLVPSPQGQQQYYLFTVDAVENFGKRVGLHYSIIDMRLRGGLGDIGPVKDVTVPLPGGQARVTEKLTAVPLPNGRDYWILVHGYDASLFYSFLLTPAGRSPAPVVSDAGAAPRNFDAEGYLRVSPDGRHLAQARQHSGLELFDFDNASGRVRNAHAVKIIAADYNGLEYSADGSKLYLSDLNTSIYQIDLARQEAVTLVGTAERPAALLRGNDERIYVSLLNTHYLGVINAPNAVGTACAFDARGVYLGPASLSREGLPNFVGAVPPVRVVLDAASATGCAGSPVALSASLVPAPAGAVLTWDFGDPAAGAANVATGAQVTHVYAAAGAYTATVAVALPTGTRPARQLLLITDPPALNLAPLQRQLCAGQPLLVGASGLPAGTTYRWRDGPTTATRAVLAPGRYVLTATSPQGCSATDSVEVLARADCAGQLVPNVITPNGDGQNDTFVLGGLVPADWDLTIYNRWGREVFRQARYENSWAATGQAAGQYYYLLVNPATGARLRGWVEVR